MIPQQLYLSTIAADAEQVAAEQGFGLELAEFCTAANMDDNFAATDALVRRKMQSSTRFIIHAPFNELFPCAIDPRAAMLVRERFVQACSLAAQYDVHRVVLHAGYLPGIYFPQWFEQRSVEFWRDFLRDVPADMQLCLENVQEPEPGMLRRLLMQVDDARLRLCLDAGHAYAFGYSTPLYRWLEEWAPFIAHFHLHDNNGVRDEHLSLGEGSAPLVDLLRRASLLCPDATYTLETEQAALSVRYLRERGLLW